MLFDLGGVLVEVGGVRAMRRLSGVTTDEDLWRRWLTCPWVRTFERGRCSPVEFASGVVHEWGLALSPDEFLRSFAAWPTGPFPGAELLVSQTAGVVPTGCLSNTNIVHWEEHFLRWPLLGWFEFRFASHEMGVLKPDREVFELVLARLGLPAERVLFLDDNLLNVEGAASCGMRSVLVQGVAEAQRALIEAGVLGPSSSRSDGSGA